MTKIRTTLILALLLLALAAPVGAYTCNASGCTWQTNYTEPGTLTNGQGLTDLIGCTASYTKAVDGGAPSAPVTFAIPASRPQGGQAVTANRTDASMSPNHTYAIAETIACTSTAFGTGPAGAPGALLMNNGVTVPGPTPTLQ